MQIQENISLAPHTSLKIGGAAEYYCAPANLKELRQALEFAKNKNLQTTLLGGGTNVLISDEGLRGLTIQLSKLREINSEVKEGELCVEALAGTPKSLLLKEFLKHKLAPAMFLAGLPGDVGGGVVMNAGIGEQLKPREFCELVSWVKVLRGQELVHIDRKDLKFTYRHSEGWQPGVIYQVGFTWPLEPMEEVLPKVKELNKWRLNKQPVEWPNSGSVFVNPEGEKSGRLIEECGLKGHQMGGAQISEKHANFIINKGSAKASDVRALIALAQETVAHKRGIQLTPEVVFLGF